MVDKIVIWDKIHSAGRSASTDLAEVAELADALRSGRSELTLVRVQIPPSAHKRDRIKAVSFVGWSDPPFSGKVGQSHLQEFLGHTQLRKDERFLGVDFRNRALGICCIREERS